MSVELPKLPTNIMKRFQTADCGCSRWMPVDEKGNPIKPDRPSDRHDTYSPGRGEKADHGYGYRRVGYAESDHEDPYLRDLQTQMNKSVADKISDQPCERHAQPSQTTGQYKLTVTYTSLSIGYASGSYSKNDALMESLREKYGDTAAITGEGGDLSQLSGEELAALEQEMQLSGQSQVMWGSYTKITIEMSFSSMEELEAALGESVDILCAARQAQSDILPRHYEGEELSAQRERMEDLFRASLEKMSDAFMDFVGGFLDRHGAIGQGQEMAMSVRSLYASYQSKYAQIAEKNGDPTGTAGTKDAWLGDHFGYLTSSLLQLGKGIEMPTKEGRYSLMELQFAAMSVTAWQSSIDKAARGEGGSEVRQALSFSMVAMKIEFASAQGTIGSKLSDTLTSVQDSVGEEILDAMDKYQEKCRREKPEEADRHPAADRDLFRRTCKRVMDHYHKTGDAMGAIREGAAQARPELEKAGKERGRAERWDRETEAGGYWDRFQKDARYGEGGVKSYERDWDGFKDRYSRRDHDDKRGDFSRKA